MNKDDLLMGMIIGSMGGNIAMHHPFLFVHIIITFVISLVVVGLFYMIWKMVR